MQHANEAAFLWSQRALAVTQVHHPYFFIRKLEQRIARHLSGLLIAPDYSWDIALPAAQEGDSGELFVLACLAFQQGNSNKIDAVLDLGQENKSAFSGLASALGWLPHSNVYPFLRSWMESENSWLRYLSLVVCSLRRLDPRDHLLPILHAVSDNPEDLAVWRALRLAGELKRRDLLLVIQSIPLPENTPAHYWGHWSRLLMGDDSANSAFESWLLAAGPGQIRAIQLAVRCQPPSIHMPWLKQLAQSKVHTPQLIIALAELGDPQHMTWLLDRMEEPAYAQLAGYAFSAMTGVDLIDGELSIKDTNRFDDEELEVSYPSGYEYLIQPDPALVRQYWKRNGAHFIAGQQYLSGQPKTKAHLENLLGHGAQGHRQAAAMELALVEPQRIYPNVKSPGLDLLEANRL
ncbi:MAG TPA: TIGR02270 family protein [Cellvibrio sp.]|nr:TIGR02270 family protein [Cellvibrio sp.]